MRVRSVPLSRLIKGVGLALPAFAVLGLAGCGGSGDESSISADQIIEANLNEQAAQVGGASTAVARFQDGSGGDWAIYNMANRLAVTPVQATKGAVYELSVAAYIRDIQVVSYNGATYALLALGRAGVAVVDITDPANMNLLSTTRVNYDQTGVTFTEGGGDIVRDQEIMSDKAPISALEADVDSDTLYIGDEGYGIHKTTLSSVLSATPPVEADGTLQIEGEVYTLQYAGENPWGGPLDLELHGGKLYAALGFLGIGIYDPATLNREGGYNLYTDASVSEDWFIDMDVATAAQSGTNAEGDAYIDPLTGMPTYAQAAFEINEVWKNGVDAPTPWANFDRYGKYYYNARKLDIADVNGSTYAYVAYSLGGLVAVDVTDPASTSYLGYAPAVPAHGPDEPTGQQSKSLFPHFGSGMLKESGVVDVKADVASDRVYYSDHFAGLVIMDHATTPSADWHGPNPPYDNDDPTLGDGTLGDHWPDYEFVTSYDMSPWDPNDHESMPQWMYDAPSLLVTGEISGHGAGLFVMPSVDSATGNVDIVQTTGAGGVNFIDLGDLGQTNMEDRFSVRAYFASTDE
ncbi:MAG: hypothetical protein PVH31_10290, partial [Ectothiorhodospiraceae bacterium]